MSKNKRLAEQVAKKIKLEDRFKPDLRRFFKQIGRDASAVWLANQTIPNLNSFELELIALLRQHYRRVSKAFSTDIRNQSKRFDFHIETKQEEDIDNEIVQYINQHSIEQSQFILQTTESELNNAAALAVAAAMVAQTRPSNREIASNIRREFDSKSEGRVNTIAMTETQTPAEEIKAIEGRRFEELIAAETLNAVILMKTWNTILDERTRTAHVLADQQVQNANDPFIVGGERLPVPGSTALGASLSNVINCRCTATYTLRGQITDRINIAPRRGAQASITAF